MKLAELGKLSKLYESLPKNKTRLSELGKLNTDKNQYTRLSELGKKHHDFIIKGSNFEDINTLKTMQDTTKLDKMHDQIAIYSEKAAQLQILLDKQAAKFAHLKEINTTLPPLPQNLNPVKQIEHSLDKHINALIDLENRREKRNKEENNINSLQLEAIQQIAELTKQNQSIQNSVAAHLEKLTLDSKENARVQWLIIYLSIIGILAPIIMAIFSR